MGTQDSDSMMKRWFSGFFSDSLMSTLDASASDQSPQPAQEYQRSESQHGLRAGVIR